MFMHAYVVRQKAGAADKVCSACGTEGTEDTKVTAEKALIVRGFSH